MFKVIIPSNVLFNVCWGDEALFIAETFRAPTFNRAGREVVSEGGRGLSAFVKLSEVPVLYAESV